MLNGTSPIVVSASGESCSLGGGVSRPDSHRDRLSRTMREDDARQ